MSEGYRRVVTGLNAEGKSCVIIDGDVPRFNDSTVAFAWRSDDHIVDNSGTADTAIPFELPMLHTTGSNFIICEFPANTPEVMHATDTIDYLVIIKGRVTLVLEDGEVDLGAGDMLIDRGVLHGWRNPHDEVCVGAVVNLPSHPVGAGRTL